MISVNMFAVINSIRFVNQSLESEPAAVFMS
jgi:hypothetical protein